MVERIEADVAIVGAGPAGIVIGAGAGRGAVTGSFCSRAAGRASIRRPSASAIPSGADPRHVDLSLATRRQLGGASNIWGGRCVPFDPIDFEARPIVGDTRWPLDYERGVPLPPARLRVVSLRRRDLRRRPDARAGGTVDRARLRRRRGARQRTGALVAADELRARLPRGALERSPIAAPGDRAHLHGDRARCQAPSADGVRSVDHLEARSSDGRRVEIEATRYVLAAGGLGSTRLLFASTRHDPDGIGNHSGHLGRWYMAHVEVRVGRVRFATPPERDHLRP